MKKRLLAVLLILGLALMTGAAQRPARAESVTAYVISNTLTVYKRVSTSSGSLGKLSYGESLTCLAANANWACVRNAAGTIGYCKLSGLSAKNPNKLDRKVYVTTASARVYKRPSTSASVMARLALNSTYTAVAITPDEKWLRIKNGSSYGYIQTKHVSADPADTPIADGDTVYIVANTLKVYAKASTSGRQLGTMSYGEALTRLSESGSWSRVRNASGSVGYCKTSGLGKDDPNTLSSLLYAQEDGAILYAKPLTSAKKLGTADAGDSFTVVAATSDAKWARVKYDGAYAYIAMSALGDKPDAPVSGAAYVVSTTLNIYKKASSSASRLGTMSYGEALTILSVDDGWAQVKNDAGDVGYCVYGSLSLTNPNTLSLTLYAKTDSVKLYSKAAGNSSVVTTLSKGASVSVVALSADGDWVRVALGAGSWAYAQTDNLSQTEPDSGEIADITSKTVYISDVSLTCYAANSSSAKALGSMSYGESLLCTGLGGGWARVINADGAIGYCLQSGLTDTDPNSYSVTLYAQADGVKVYKRTSESSGVLATLALNAQVVGVAITGDQSWIRLKNGSEYGYVPADLLGSSPASSGGGTKAQQVAALAKSLLGKPYVYGASGPSSFDCSGLTYYVYYKVLGIKLGRTAYKQGSDNSYAKITKMSDLKVGDLVFFDTDASDDDKCDHSGVYIGNYTVIHSSSVAGKVISSTMKDSSSYYYRTFSWARRIV